MKFFYEPTTWMVKILEADRTYMTLIKSYISSLLAMIFLTMSLLQANAAVQNCEFRSSGFNSSVFASDDVQHSYSVDIGSENNWSIEKFDRHAPGALLYENNGERVAWGVFHFYTEKKARELGHPKDVEERIKRRSELFGHPYRSVFGSDLSVASKYSDFNIGKFTGYAVVFDISNEWIKFRSNLLRDNAPTSLIAISQTDNCVRFETTFMVVGKETDPKEVVSDVLNHLKIEKKSVLIEQ